MGTLIWVLLGILAALIIIVAAIFLTVFWVLMIIDAVKREFDSDGEKVAWVLIVILIGLLGAIIYYFAVKKNAKKVIKKEVKKKRK